MSSLFLDTGFLIALESRSDQNHQAAVGYWQHFCQQPCLLVTTTFVFDEVVTYFNSRNQHNKAVEIGTYLQTSQLIELVSVNDELLKNAWDLFKAHHDKRYSLTDCASFVLMKAYNIGSALSFDRHFTQAGFTRLPEKSG